MADKITCQICGAEVHSIQLHLRDHHEEVSLADYQERFPDAPIMSELAQRRLEEKRIAGAASPTTRVAMAGASTAEVTKLETGARREPLHEVFALGKVKAALNARGEPIPITVMSEDPDNAHMIPEIDKSYVFGIELLKTVLLGLELNIPVYLWGHAGVGKTTMLEQVCAHTRRPAIRVQHTANTEEAHIIGQTLANEKGTYFEPGPLAMAMRFGWTYLADEYDFAFANVLAVYQPVLEGKPLVIKEAPPEWRHVQPHKNFRFCATGNTNGAGDETGLYIGTNLGNAANYSRFGIVDKVDYMPKAQEVAVLCNQAGIIKEDAEKIVNFAAEIRKAHDKGDMSSTVGPRELINAAKIGMRRGSWRVGLGLSFINRLGKVDAEVANGVAQRIFD